MTAPRRDTGHDLMRFAHLGFLGAAAITLFGFLGWKLDEWLGTFPLLALLGALLGAAGWMLIVVREASTLGSGKARKPRASRDEPTAERRDDDA